MRIGIDARELAGRATGAGRYLGGLLRQWSIGDRAKGHEFILYSPEPLDFARDRPLIMSLDAHRFATRVIPGHGGTWWLQMRLPGAAAGDHLDMFFAPAYEAPLRVGAPTVVAIHDLSFVAHPEWFSTREGIRRRWLTRASARKAGAIVTISEFSRQELMESLGVPASRIHVIPPGVNRLTPAKAGGREPRVLFVGSIFNRRHVPDLVRAFALVARRVPHASLDLVGDNRTHPREDVQGAIDAQALESPVRWHHYASDDELRELYGRATAFAFLSEYEGLGLTPLEALAAGVPSVLLDTPVARESCGEAALYVRLGDIAGAAGAIERLLTDEPLRARLLAAAPAVLARYDWSRAAADTLTVIERCAAERM